MTLFSDLWQDVRYSVRTLRKSPSFAIVAVLALAFGIGVNTGIFTILNAIALRPLPVADAGKVVGIYQSLRGKVGRNVSGSTSYFSYPEYLNYRDNNHVFSGLAVSANAAASLGQVHRARLKNGEEVAVKVQYPGIDATVRQDLGNLKLLLRTLQAIAGDLMRQKIETRTVYRELEERLIEELDYRVEARNTMEFHRLYAGDPETIIPCVIGDLSSRRVLTMTYLDGYHLSDLMNPAADLELRKWVTRKYYELVWRQLLEFGVLHTDPHPGNYLVTHHPHICILDFGSIRRYPDAIRRANLQFARALVERNDRALGQSLVKLGYLDRGQNARPMIEAVHLLFEPVLEDRPYGPDEYDLVGKLALVGEIAFKHKLYKSPAHGLFTVRALVGLDGIMRGLGVRANYHDLFRDCVTSVKA